MKGVKKFPGIMSSVVSIFNSKGEIDLDKTKNFIYHLIESNYILKP